MRSFVIGALLVGMAGSAAGAEPLRVAIVPGLAVNLDTARVDALAQDLAQSLGSELDAVVTGGLEVRRMLPPDGVPPDCVTMPACIADVGQRTGASQLLFVVMVDSGAGGSSQIDSTWVDVATGQSVSRPAIDLTSVAEARTRFAAAARLLLPDVPVRAKPPTEVATHLVGVGVHAGAGQPVPRHFTTPAKIAAAVGGVGLGAGIAFGLITRSRYDACDRAPADCTDGKRSSIRTYAAVADVGFVLATGGAIATAVLYLTSGKEPHVIVAPTAEGAAVSAIGRF